ncbi:MAG: CpXC domain-containing protein [Lachnospiraceae bacterium]|nr:CpXC domain-containing protein [Lachnospiraceae bacterium]
MPKNKMTYKEVEVECPKCGKRHPVKIYERIYATDYPLYKKMLKNNELFVFDCTETNERMTYVYPSLFQDDENNYMVLFLPGFTASDIEKTDFVDLIGLGEEEYQKMCDNYKVRVVGSINQLLEKVLIFDEEMDDRAVEIQKAMLANQVKKESGKNIHSFRFELLKDHKYGYTVTFTDNTTALIKLDMDQYYHIYLANKKMINERTPEGFAYIEAEWGVESLFAMADQFAKDKGKGKGKRKKYQ